MIDYLKALPVPVYISIPMIAIFLGLILAALYHMLKSSGRLPATNKLPPPYKHYEHPGPMMFIIDTKPNWCPCCATRIILFTPDFISKRYLGCTKCGSLFQYAPTSNIQDAAALAGGDLDEATF